MSIEQQLIERSGNQCELTKSNENLTVYHVAPSDANDANNNIYISSKCVAQLTGAEAVDPDAWRILNETMWSEVPAVQVVAWRMLNRLKNEAWAADALDILYLDDALLEWAKAGAAVAETDAPAEADVHRDSNGTELKNGDSVTLIKSLDVKGSSINAKMGTAVRNIKLVHDNTDQIEGKIDGQQIVILTKFVRKTG